MSFGFGKIKHNQKVYLPDAVWKFIWKNAEIQHFSFEKVLEITFFVGKSVNLLRLKSPKFSTFHFMPYKSTPVNAKIAKFYLR